jgi:hypothetical protein
MEMKRLILISCLCALLTSTVALGNPTAGADKWLQLPDPYGWDVAATNTSLADDWMCSQSGPVSDIHFWVSFRGDLTPPEGGAPDIHISIRDNIPASAKETDDFGYDFSMPMPGTPLWERTFKYGEYNVEPAGTGSQGWYDPVTGYAQTYDHYTYYLVNIDPIQDPFTQVAGNIYWLEIQALLPPGADYQVGWKTSNDHFMDDAVYAVATANGYWPLTYPYNDLYERGGQSIDLAFVITPEPATICLLGLGALSLLRRKRGV